MNNCFAGRLCLFAFSLVSALIESQVAADDVTPTPDQIEFFEAKIRPVLVTHCYECHSATAGVPKGGLRLDSRDAVLAGGDSGPAVIIGNVKDSVLLKALRYESSEMPPSGRLPSETIADFEQWIHMGMPDPRTGAVTTAPAGVDYEKGLEFWAFRPPVKSAAPPVTQTTWVKNDIDRFVLHRLESVGLKPAEVADRRTLIRRV